MLIAGLIMIVIYPLTIQSPIITLLSEKQEQYRVVIRE